MTSITYIEMDVRITIFTLCGHSVGDRTVMAEELLAKSRKH